PAGPTLQAEAARRNGGAADRGEDAGIPVVRRHRDRLVGPVARAGEEVVLAVEAHREEDAALRGGDAGRRADVVGEGVAVGGYPGVGRGVRAPEALLGAEDQDARNRVAAADR